MWGVFFYSTQLLIQSPMNESKFLDFRTANPWFNPGFILMCWPPDRLGSIGSVKDHKIFFLSWKKTRFALKAGEMQVDSCKNIPESIFKQRVNQHGRILSSPCLRNICCPGHVAGWMGTQRGEGQGDDLGRSDPEWVPCPPLHPSWPGRPAPALSPKFLNRCSLRTVASRADEQQGPRPI